jgi:hypothetical protein
VILEILAGVLAAALLLGCIFGGPLLLRRTHESMLQALAMEGVSVVSHRWTLSGLRIDRPRWHADVHFQPARLGGGRPGHLRYRAAFTPAPPPVGGRPSEAAIPTGDPAFDSKINVEGDPALARKLLTPEMRERFVRLDGFGGRVLAIGEGFVEIDGPLLGQAPLLKEFLELCDAIVDKTVAAAGA